MASYSYNFIGTYSNSSPNFELIDSDISSGVLSDIDAGNVFSANEVLSNSGEFGPGTSSFLGTVTVDGVTIILTTSGGSNFAWVQVAVPGTYSLPGSIAQSAVSAENFTTCLLPGVRIATPSGHRPVETLTVGDAIVTLDGRSVLVKWMGHQTVVTAFGPAECAWPVLIVAGALGEDSPTADLRVTADHALLVDGLLVQAGALVNGSSIRRLTLAELGERYVVYHVETDDHETILAEGVPVETFVDNVARRRFDNYAEYLALYGETAASISEMALPRVKSARQLPRAVRERIAARAAALGCSATAAA